MRSYYGIYKILFGPIMLTRLTSILAGGLFLPVAVLSAREPTSLEQYYLELVNRARANPTAEVTRLAGKTWGDNGSPAAPDLNEGIAPNTISAAAKPPLAFDTRLIDSASNYTNFLLANEKFSHTANGTPTSRMIAAGFPFSGSYSTGENLANTASTGPHPVNAERVEEHHDGLFIDGNVPGRGHRISLMNADFREVGIAIRADFDGQSFWGPGYNEVISTQNFAKSGNRIFVTGVLYTDLNTNGFYDPGESAGIIDLRVVNTGGTTLASGRSFGSGGYSINMAGVAAGSYRLVGRDSFGFEKSENFVWGGTQNMKVDFVNPGFIAPPVFSTPYLPDAMIGLSLTRLTGNNVYQNSPTGQAVRQVARTTRPLTWHAQVQNDGSLSDFIRTTGTRGNRFFRVTYLRRVGVLDVNVTAAVTAGRSDNLAAGVSSNYRMLVQPLKPALGRRNGITVALRAQSTAESARIDRVNAVALNSTKKPKKKKRR